jgi:hypothetical protein
MADRESVRWHIVHKRTGNVAEGQPANGFGTQEEAEEVHMAQFRGNPSLEVRAVPIR